MRMGARKGLELPVSVVERYLMIAQDFSMRALEHEKCFEHEEAAELREGRETEHSGFVIGAVIFSVAALEAYVNERFNGEHNLTREQRAEVHRDDSNRHRHTSSLESTLCALYQLKKIESERHFGSGVVNLIFLRNQFVHFDNEVMGKNGPLPFKTEDEGSLIETMEFFSEKLKRHELQPNPFAPEAEMFPYGMLSASLARWAAESARREIEIIADDLEKNRD